jgi:hypothetical protein
MRATPAILVAHSFSLVRVIGFINRQLNSLQDVFQLPHQRPDMTSSGLIANIGLPVFI